MSLLTEHNRIADADEPIEDDADEPIEDDADEVMTLRDVEDAVDALNEHIIKDVFPKMLKDGIDAALIKIEFRLERQIEAMHAAYLDALEKHSRRPTVKTITYTDDGRPERITEETAPETIETKPTELE